MRRVGRVLAAIAAFGFGYIAFIYFTLPDVRELRTRNLPSTAFMDLRAREARADGPEPKHLQRWVPYGRISPHLKRAVLVAERAAEHFNTCRAKGIQGSNTDFLICAIAERDGLPVFTTDEDFSAFASVLPVQLHLPSRRA